MFQPQLERDNRPASSSFQFLSGDSTMSSTTAGDNRFTKHGLPKGFRFVPTQLELFTILGFKIRGRRLHPKVAGIFHDLDILDHHPQELHDQYECDKEHRFIYFFSWRQFQKQAGGGGPAVHKKRQRGAAGGQDEDDNEPRPVRLAKGGGWKPSGGGQVLRWPKDKGGFIAGKMVTMVFYDHHGGEQVKSQWGMHEFTIPVDPRLHSKLTKATRLEDLALYRLYKLKDMDGNDGAGSNQTLANFATADGHFSAGQPSLGIFTGRNQPLAAGASTSRMPPPPPPPRQQQQHRIPNVGHPQPQNYHLHQYAFGAAPASAAHHRVHTMTMPPAYRTGMPGRQLVPMERPPGNGLPFRQLVPMARPPGNGLPGRQSLQFARPLVPPQMPVPPAAANPASHHHAPAKPATHGGAGQEASDSGATLSPPSVPVSTPLPAAENPSAEELALMTATHGGAGQEAGGDSGATRCSLAAGSQPAERDATATAEAGQHVQLQLADCVIKPEEERMPPPPIEDDNNDGIEMEWYLDLGKDLELGMDLDRFQCTMDELCAAFDEPPPTQPGDNN